MYYQAIDYWNSPPNSYLEHHGVKGMKWGHRKQIPLIGRTRRANQAPYGIQSNRVSTNNTASAQKKGLSRGQKIAIGVGVGAVVAVGAAAGVYAMKKYGARPTRTLSTDQLTKMGIATFKPETFKPETIKVDRVPIDRADFRQNLINLEKSSGLDIAKNRASRERIRAAMKTPVKNIVKGRTTMRSLGTNAKNRVENNLDIASRNMRNSWSSGNAQTIRNATRKHAAALANYQKATITGPVYSYNGQYRPRLTTNSGKQIVKRLIRK